MDHPNRRSFQRHVLGNSSLIICEAGSGEVIDISPAGIAFTPLTFKQWPKEVFQADLLLNLPATTILNITCSLAYPDPELGSSSARCGITFHNLTTAQQEEIETFCEHYKFIPLTA